MAMIGRTEEAPGGAVAAAPSEPTQATPTGDSRTWADGLAADFLDFRGLPGKVTHRIGEAITRHIPHRRTDTH